MADYKITDEGDPRRYYTQLPNMIDDAGLSVYAFRLYSRIKRVAGDGGKCYQSTKTLAEACNMSAGSVSNAKQELIDAGLIRLEVEHDKKKGYDYHVIRIVDIWAQNMKAYSQDEPARSPDERGRSPHEEARSPDETKNNPYKNNPYKNGGSATGEIFALAMKIHNGTLGPDQYLYLDSLFEDYPSSWIKEALEQAITDKAFSGGR